MNGQKIVTERQTVIRENKDRLMEKQIDEHTERCINIRMNIQTDGHTDKSYRQMDT